MSLWCRLGFHAWQNDLSYFDEDAGIGRVWMHLRIKGIPSICSRCSKRAMLRY